MQLYLPDDLYDEVKKRNLPASELLQNAVRAELRRLRLIDEADAYLKEAIGKYGEPEPEDIAWAEDLVRSIKEHEAAAAADETQPAERPKRRRATRKAR